MTAAEMVKFAKNGSDATQPPPSGSPAGPPGATMVALRRTSVLLRRRLVHRHDPMVGRRARGRTH